jgi:hypothetical protein
MMKQHGVGRVEELIDLLPDQRYRPHPLRRLRAILRAMVGGSPYNPDNAIRRELRQRGYYTAQHIHTRIRQVREWENNS